MQEPLTETQQKESNLQTRGQRQIHLIWELTQAGIALAVTLTTLLVFSNRSGAEGVGQLASAFFLVIGFYFGRTQNHTENSTGSKLGLGPLRTNR